MRADRPSITARWVAAQRTRLHGSRPSSPGADLDAELRLYRGFGRALALAPLRPTGMATRTSFIDDEVVAALDRGVEQFVLVGAGHDGRALRFGAAGVRWFEVDHPATQPDKRRRLEMVGAGTESVTFLSVDLLIDDLGAALDRAGHSLSRPTLFVCEGLFTYLPNGVGEQLCTLLRSRAGPGSRFAANFLIAGPSRSGLLKAVDRILATIGERRQGIYRAGDPERMLAATGWRIQRRSATSPNPLAGRSHLLLVAADPT